MALTDHPQKQVNRILFESKLIFSYPIMFRLTVTTSLISGKALVFVARLNILVDSFY